jgi:hypothetical protein
MINSKYLAIVLLALASSLEAGKQENPANVDVHAEVVRTYNFQPHTLNSKQINEKSGILDQFWTKAKSQRDVYVPGLRRELADFRNPPFFLFDGSQLLLSLSSEPADRKIALAAISHSDLRDVQWKDYFMLVQGMAAQGEDTTAVAFHILEQPKFKVFIPQHVLTLAQNYSLVYMLIPTNQDFWVKPAIGRLRSEKDETAQQSLLLLLWYSQTNDSDRAIVEFSKDASNPKSSRSYADELSHRKDEISSAERAEARGSSEESVRQARRERMKAISDEALYDLDSYTVKLMAKRN